MATSENIQKALVWSNLSDIPLCFHETHWDATLCAWNGVVFTHKLGLTIVASKWCGIYATYAQRIAIMNEIERLTRAGLQITGQEYDVDNWSGVMSKVKHGIAGGKYNYFDELMKKYDTSTALSWFDVDRIKIHDTPHRYNDTAHYSATFT